MVETSWEPATLTLGIGEALTHKTIVIHNSAGQVCWLNFENDKLETGGNLPMSEAAQIFFDEVKRIAELKP